jgi:hypothetical protein
MMKSVLLAFDGANYSEGALAFARQLNGLQPIRLVGAFIPQLDFSNMLSITGNTADAAVLPVVTASDSTAVQKNIDRFSNDCESLNIPYTIRKDGMGFGITELRNESRFVDLVILGAESFYHNLGSEGESYVREALQQSECPAVVVPENYSFPATNVLAYDGSESAVYAIKQFAYLFPELRDHPTHLVYFESDDEAIPHKAQMEDWLRAHFSNITMIRMDVEQRNYFKLWISEKEKCILVSGSFGRSLMSQFFRKSFVADLLHEHQVPLFIAHK